MPNLRRFLIIQGIIIFLAFSPLIAAISADLIGNTLGCEVHEGFINPCIVLGQDIGEQLTTAFVSGWFALITMPIGFGVWLVHLGYGLFRYFRARKK